MKYQILFQLGNGLMLELIYAPLGILEQEALICILLCALFLALRLIFNSLMLTSTPSSILMLVHHRQFVRILRAI